MITMVISFSQINQRPKGFRPLEQFGHNKVDREDGFQDGLDRELGSIKMKILAFQGKNNLEAYLEWEKKIELMFKCHYYSKVKKGKLIIIEFNGYAIIWWN